MAAFSPAWPKASWRPVTFYLVDLFLLLLPPAQLILLEDCTECTPSIYFTLSLPSLGSRLCLVYIVCCVHALIHNQFEPLVLFYSRVEVAEEVPWVPTHVPVEADDHSLKYTNMERLKCLSAIRAAVRSGGNGAWWGETDHWELKEQFYILLM